MPTAITTQDLKNSRPSIASDDDEPGSAGISNSEALDNTNLKMKTEPDGVDLQSQELGASISMLEVYAAPIQSAGTMTVIPEASNSEMGDDDLLAVQPVACTFARQESDLLDDQIRSLVESYNFDSVDESLMRIREEIAATKRKERKLRRYERHSTTDLEVSRSNSNSPPLFERAKSTNAINLSYLVNHFVDKVQLQRQSKTIQDQELEKIDLEKKRAKEQRLKAAILDAAFDAMLAFDAVSWKITLVNQRACEQFGYTEEELVGKPIEILFGLTEGDQPWPVTELHLHRGASRDVWARRSDQTEFPAMLGIEVVERHDDDDDADTELLVAFIRDVAEEKRAVQLEIANKASESLLLNMLPEEIVFRLKDDPSHIAEYHPNATILFADICGFTELCSQKEAVQIVNILNDLFTRFDSITDAFGLNKVKTIGDCYMVTDIPQRANDENSCAAVCQFALEMILAIQDYNQEHPDEPVNLRIGINRGPVVAGVVGRTRFLYDLWGDAVNIASRMESTGVVGRVQVTQAVVNHTCNEFEFESRGAIHVKGIGMMETFMLTQIKSQNPSDAKKFLVPAEERQKERIRTTGGSNEDWGKVLSVIRAQSPTDFESKPRNLHQSMMMDFELKKSASRQRLLPTRSRSSYD
jgi:PAS domain S-box-containing protein